MAFASQAFASQDSLVAQRITHLPALQETRLQSLGWEDPLEKGMATHSIILTQEISWQITVHGVAKELDMV